jgi:folate-binding protein YgfZ
MLLERLQRFFLRVKAEMSVAERRCVLFEPAETALHDRSSQASRPYFFLELELASDGSGTDFDLPLPPRSVDVSAAAESVRWERRRLQLAVPSMSHEILTPRIPASLGALVMSRTVSLTKGCYTGQELVARMDARDARPPEIFFSARTRIDALSLDLSKSSTVQVDRSQIHLVDSQRESVGEVTSIGQDESGEVRVLGFVKRSRADGRSLMLRFGEAAVVALEGLDTQGS